jgi:ribonucleoside-diphosphate reductase alpha chain
MVTFTPNALKILGERYLYKYDEGQEDVDAFIDRISMGNEVYKRELFQTLNFLPNSPTLFNIGIPGAGTLSACFKFDVRDSLLDGPGSIMAVGHKSAGVQKYGGGVGYVFSAVRPRGTPIATTHGKAMGPVALLKYYQSVAEMITQGGKRAGAQMGILSCDHPDIREFIHCKDADPQRLNTFNTSVACTDAFMEAASNEPTSEAGVLLTEMAESAWRTGDPGVYFIDTAERRNPTPWLGKLTGTNPCGEVPLLDNEPCNLGSINLGNFVDGGRVDYPALQQVVRLATRYLDDVLSVNTFPSQEITDANALTRKLGLGVCGWADMLALLSIHYDSDEAVALGRELMQFINEEAYAESTRLGMERGICPAFAIGGGLTDWQRNATRTCIAPTGTIAILMGASSGIEPHFALEWNRQLATTGDVIHERVPVMDRLQGFTPHVSQDIAAKWHIAHQAAFQEYTDLAVSKTINLPNEATAKEIREIYINLWASGCLGGTIYRDGSRDVQVLTMTETLDNRTHLLDGVADLVDYSKCPLCGAGAVHAEGCMECAAMCGWSACAT